MRLNHLRTLVGLAGLLAISTVSGPTSADGFFGASGRFDRPQGGYASPWTTLRRGTPEQVGLDPAPIQTALQKVHAWTEAQGTAHPMFGGAVTMLVHDGVVVTHDVTGHALRYADKAGTELPREQWVPMQADTLFDMASVSKLFTSILVMQQVEARRVDLDAPVSRYVPEFAANGKEAISVRRLLTHTSGLPSGLPLWRDWPDKPSRIKAALEAKLLNEPGTKYLYSDLNLIALGVLCERVAGRPLDVLVREGITAPLGMVDTGYNPSARNRAAATEYESVPPRGMVRGEVHDENTWALGGVAGHAGIFSTAADMAVLGQALLNGGTYRGRRILRASTIDQMLTDNNGAFPGNAHGLGFELDQMWYMDGLSSMRTAGHTGFTGTSFVVDFQSRSIAILLTNRVHPTRDWGSNNPSRRAVAQGLAQALAVRPLQGRDAWFSGVGEERTATLATADLRTRGSGPAHATFHVFVDTEPTDTLLFESSVDHGASWQAVSARAYGTGAPDSTVTALSGEGHRAWWFVDAALPVAGASHDVALRWRYVTDKVYSGRGVYLDGIRVWDDGGILLDGERDPQRFTADGWRPATR
ncbi:serine hydrolase [Pendulispora rubella]|uniref:Serine hydrolase n=1 Tax=Pendulispora rubella TaxID=2741070 RepID=A0ABZ2LAW9_9BACT